MLMKQINHDTPYTPVTVVNWISGRFLYWLTPSRFHGKPVKRWVRTISAQTHPHEARNASRRLRRKLVMTATGPSRMFTADTNHPQNAKYSARNKLRTIQPTRVTWINQ